MQLWLVILRYFAGVMAWMTVIAVNAAFAGCTLFAFARSGRLGDMGSVGAVTPSSPFLNLGFRSLSRNKFLKMKIQLRRNDKSGFTFP